MKPVLQALLVADHVYTDVATGKKVVAGIFHSIRFAKQPTSQEQFEGGKLVQIQIPASGMRAGSPFCYISLTELRGKQKFTLRYVFLNEDALLFSADLEIDRASPLETVEVVLPLPLLPATKVGTYALELLWNDEPLGSHRINVVEVDITPANGEGNERRDD